MQHLNTVYIQHYFYHLNTVYIQYIFNLIIFCFHNSDSMPIANRKTLYTWYNNNKTKSLIFFKSFYLTVSRCGYLAQFLCTFQESMSLKSTVVFFLFKIKISFFYNTLIHTFFFTIMSQQN
jgi:hypothetical protein